MEYDKDKVDEMILALLYLDQLARSICDPGVERLGCEHS